MLTSLWTNFFLRWGYLGEEGVSGTRFPFDSRCLIQIAMKEFLICTLYRDSNSIHFSTQPPIPHIDSHIKISTIDCLSVTLSNMKKKKKYLQNGRNLAYQRPAGNRSVSMENIMNWFLFCYIYLTAYRLLY